MEKFKDFVEGQKGATDAPKGPESYEDQYKRRLVKTTALTKKLYKNKPSQAEFNKQMKRIAGHEFG